MTDALNTAREALELIANGRERRFPDGHTEVVDVEDPAEIARKAISALSAAEAPPAQTSEHPEAGAPSRESDPLREFKEFVAAGGSPIGLHMPTDPEWYRRKIALEDGCEIGAGGDYIPHPQAGAPSRELFERLTNLLARCAWDETDAQTIQAAISALYPTPPALKASELGEDQKSLEAENLRIRRQMIGLVEHGGAHLCRAEKAEAQLAKLAEAARLAVKAFDRRDDVAAAITNLESILEDHTPRTVPLSTISEGWRPIETAPKDGTPILAYGPLPGWNSRDHGWHGVRETRWDCYPQGSPGYDKWTRGEGPLGIGWEWYEPVHNWQHHWQPTHWLPLPAPPAPTQDAEGEG